MFGRLRVPANGKTKRNKWACRKLRENKMDIWEIMALIRMTLSRGVMGGRSGFAFNEFLSSVFWVGYVELLCYYRVTRLSSL